MNWHARYKLINLARNSTGLRDDEDWRAALRRVAGVDSIKKLDDPGFDLLMDFFRDRGFVSSKRQRAYNRTDRGVMASAGQVAMIRELWTSCTSGGGSEDGFRTFIAKLTGVSDLRFVDRRGAHTLITALTSWKQRNENRAVTVVDDAG